MNETTLPYQYRKERPYDTTQHIRDQPFSLHSDPMSILYFLSALSIGASVVLMSQSEEWRVLAVLALASSMGAAFDLCYSSLTKAGFKMPWQIRAARFGASLTGGVGIGSVVVWIGAKWFEFSPGPLPVFGAGFFGSAMAIAIFRTIQPVILRRLQRLGHVETPNPPSEIIDLTAWKEYRENPSTRIVK
jgi:hypothetical protein